MGPEQTNTPTLSEHSDATFKMAAANRNSELYHQIAREDEDAPVVQKKKKSFVMMVVVAFMKATLYLDSLKRTNEPLFRLLNFFWVIWVGVLYLCGILVLVFSIYNRLQLPIYLEDQLQARGIQFESADYGMDRIEVRNLTGPNNAYTVDTLIVYTTFTDLLQKRIRSVIVDGLSITLDADPKFNPIQDIPELLTRLQNPVRGKMDLTINALTINNARLNLVNQDMELPISFSLEGMYADTTQVIVPLSISEPSLKAKGTLSVVGGTSHPEWILSVSEGRVTLPRHPPEDFKGELRVSLDGKALEGVQASFKIGTGSIDKKLTATLKKAEDGLSGQIVWDKTNTTEPEKSSNLSLDIDYLTLLGENALQTKGNLTVKSKQFYTTDFGFKDLVAPLSGEIVCSNWQTCQVNILESSKVVLQDFWMNYRRQKFQSQQPVRFSVLPQEKLFIFEDLISVMRFSIPLQGVVLEAENPETSEKLMVSAGRLSLNGMLADQSQVSLYADELSYQTPVLRFKEATVTVNNMLQSTADGQMRAKNVVLAGVPILSQPFDLVLDMVGDRATARVSVREQPIELQLEGQVSLDQKTFVGQVNLKPFDLKDLTVPPQVFWPNLSESISNLSGQVAARGQLKWSGAQNIRGPLYVGLKDVSFQFGETRFWGVNTVLTVEALAPFITREKQHLFIQSIDDIIPLKNLDAVFQVDAQNLKILQLFVSAAGLPLMAPQSVLSLKNTFLIALKNNRVLEAKTLKGAWHLPNLNLTTGSAAISVPIEVQESGLRIPNVTVRLQDAVLQRQGDAYSELFGKAATGYFIRNGQIIMDQDKLLQISLNGRLLPDKTTKDAQWNKIPLPEFVFQPVAAQEMPQDIQSRLKALFEENS